MEITRENIANSNKLTAVEKIIIQRLLYWEADGDAFIMVNERILNEINSHRLFAAIWHLVSLGIIKRRECEAIAYEWDNKNLLKSYL